MPSSGTGNNFSNGFDLNFKNIINPKLNIPWNIKILVLKSDDIFWKFIATKKPYKDITQHHKSMDPSWFPHEPEILYNKGLEVWEFSYTLINEKSEVIKAATNVKKQPNINVVCNKVVW